MKLYTGLYKDGVNEWREAYRLLCGLLGIDWTTDIAQMARRVNAMWWHPDHGKLPQTTHYTDTQLLAALQIILGETSIYQPRPVPADIVIGRFIRTGVKFPALVRSWREDFPDRLPNAREVLCSFGSRARRDDLDGTLASIWEQADKAGLGGVPWVEQQRALGHGGLAREFELGILSLYIAYGDQLELGRTAHNGAVQHLHLGNTTVKVVDAPSVSQAVGYERPTSASAMQFLVGLFPPRAGETQVLYSGAPHTLRVSMDAATAAWNAQVHEGYYPYTNTTFYAAGSVNKEFINPPAEGAADRRPYGTKLALGELARFAWKAAKL